jgi:hypothetical protein
MVAVGFAPTALGSLPRARNSLNKVAPIITFRRLLVRPTIAGRARPDVSSSMSRSAPLLPGSVGPAQTSLEWFHIF